LERGQKAFTAKNPPYGALLSYYLKEAVLRRRQRRQRGKDKKNAVEEKSKTDTKGDAAEKKEGKVKSPYSTKTEK